MIFKKEINIKTKKIKNKLRALNFKIIGIILKQNLNNFKLILINY